MLHVRSPGATAPALPLIAMVIVLACTICPFKIQLEVEPGEEVERIKGMRCPSCARPMLVVDAVETKRAIYCPRSTCGSRDVASRGVNEHRCRKCGWSWGSKVL